jgi:hypothetical protein
MRPGLVLALLDGVRLRHIGRVAVGRQELEALEPVVREIGRDTAPCAGAGKAVAWLEPALACEVGALRRAGATPCGIREVQAREGVARLLPRVALGGEGALA